MHSLCSTASQVGATFFRKEMVSDTERNRCRVVNRVRSTCLCISMLVINSRRNREVWYGAIIRGPSSLSLSRSGTLTHRQTDTMGTARPRSAWRARTERDRGRIVWLGEGVRGRQRQRRSSTTRARASRREILLLDSDDLWGWTSAILQSPYGVEESFPKIRSANVVYAWSDV